ncbi:MAG: hypothetical protein N2109_09495 [Fimbriimonadales bacterium]|nr:hypothetical protein [Fimbriimonadales bacterium]
MLSFPALVAGLLGASAGPVRIAVDPSRDLGAVNRSVLGHNVEAADPKGIFAPRSDPYVTRTGTGLWDPENRQPDPTLLQALRRIGTPLLRYPGGCLAHGFRWKQTIGPVESRGDFAFGLDEFLSYCEAAGAQPIITVGDYSCTPQDASDLVEYLNAPATPSHPWAMRRALNGHPEAYGVVWFELGNESDHGNHDLEPRRVWTAREYAEWFLASVRAMKAIDRRIRCGVVLSTTFPRWNSGWSDEVLRRTRDAADFAVAHCYSVALTSERQAEQLPLEWMLQAPLASIDAFDRHLAIWRDRVRQACGRSLPVAVTEFNAMFLQEKPRPLRFSLASALFCAGFVLKMADPRSGVLLANYWQFANGYWGMVQTRNPSGPRRLPAYWAYELLEDGLLPRLNAAGGFGPTVEFRPPVPIGIAEPCHGPRAEPDRAIGPNLFRADAFEPGVSDRWRSFAEGGAFALRVGGVDAELHVRLAEVRAPRGATLEISFEGKFEGTARGAKLGLSAIDRRGWEPFHSGVAIEGVESARDWSKFSARFPTLPGSDGCLLVWRAIPRGEPLSGVLRIRNVTVRTLVPAHQPGFPALQMFASSDPGKGRGAILLLRRDTGGPLDVVLELRRARPTALVARTLAGRLEANNLDAEEAVVRTLPTQIDRMRNTVALRLPRHSLTLVRYSWAKP